jgi:hypothetical protein
MPELVTKSIVQEQQERKIETRTVVERIAGSTRAKISGKAAPSGVGCCRQALL